MGYSQQDCRSIGSSLLLDSVLLLCGMMLSMVRGSSFSTMGVLFYILQLF
jgi:predicted histidine transporter YuiF (NhaC family)